ncbi:hypothetical protein AB4Z22_14760 [Paenibacillus sp. TAF58]
MFITAFLLCLTSIILLLLGLINPKMVLPKFLKNRNRKQVLLIYLVISLLFFVTFVVVAPPLSPERKAELEAERVVKEKAKVEAEILKKDTDAKKKSEAEEKNELRK